MHAETCPFSELARIEALVNRVLETKHGAAITRELQEIIHIAQSLANDLDVERENA